MINDMITIIIFLLIIGLLLYLVWNQTDKLYQLEKINRELSELISRGVDASYLLSEETEKIKAKELFEKDDEVGTIFTRLTEIIKIYEEFMTKLVVENNINDPREKD